MSNSQELKYINNYDNQTDLERLHDEARELLRSKEKEISEYNAKIETAERKLASLKAEIRQFKRDNDDLHVHDNDYTSGEEIERLKLKQEQEIQSLVQKNQEEIRALNSAYEDRLLEAKNWAEKHAQTICLEKEAYLESLRKEIESLKANIDENEFAHLQAKANLYQASRDQTQQNEHKLQFLENQISEVSSLAKQEIRDIRTKIEETISTADIRTREYKEKEENMRREFSTRELDYDNHISALMNQFEVEKRRYCQSIKTSEEKLTRIEGVIKQIEKQHDNQMKTTLKDIERMKNTIYKSKAKTDTLMLPTILFSETKIQNLAKESHNIEQEIRIIDSELLELKKENDNLSLLIAKLSREEPPQNVALFL